MFEGLGLGLGGPVSSLFYHFYGVDGAYIFFICMHTSIIGLFYLLIDKRDIETDLSALEVKSEHTSSGDIDRNTDN